MNYIKNNYKTIFVWFGLLCMVLFVLNYFHQKQLEAESKLQQAIALTKQQAENMNVLQNELKISKQNAEQLADAVKKAQSNQVKPIMHITVQAPTVEQAAAEVKTRIEKKDTALPPITLENTDRIVVAPQPDNEDYQVIRRRSCNFIWMCVRKKSTVARLFIKNQ